MLLAKSLTAIIIYSHRSSHKQHFHFALWIELSTTSSRLILINFYYLLVREVLLFVSCASKHLGECVIWRAVNCVSVRKRMASCIWWGELELLFISGDDLHPPKPNAAEAEAPNAKPKATEAKRGRSQTQPKPGPKHEVKVIRSTCRTVEKVGKVLLCLHFYFAHASAHTSKCEKSF